MASTTLSVIDLARSSIARNFVSLSADIDHLPSSELKLQPAASASSTVDSEYFLDGGLAAGCTDALARSGFAVKLSALRNTFAYTPPQY
eukprot:CAMPEP_0198215042 /NCGR_PEP_ID=MMETSP1445-20131203/46477_1 /TAXON_ID=36898 /ORGANISM="Pyramimonas sp., Strain CCMP2087" /LENGTH=88 /DNA_ID=CAMNT_0043890555 /DNA_START=1049 /DNA_END=1316 /DNA_ORIENTATION=+